MVQTVCRQCGSTVASSDVRYVSANHFLCTECFDGRHGRMRGEKGLTEKRSQYNADPVQKKTLVCGKCEFVNRFRPDAENVVCGYCGSKELHAERTSAASLIAEADEFDTEG